MNNFSYQISKSSFLKLVQCPKAFYLYKKHPYLRDKLSIDKQLTFKRGHDIGYFAQQLFPGGKDVSKLTKSTSTACKLTRQLIMDKAPVIYEATFVFNSTLIMVDILVLENEVYKAYEVKSSLKVSEIYLRDACLQYYILKNALPAFEDLFLVTINGDYILDDEIDPKLFFKKRSVKKEGEENISYFESQINEGLLLLEKNTIPNIAIGKHCFKPYQCDFFETCWKGKVSENSIFNLPLVNRDKLFEWQSMGLNSLEQLDDNHIENPVIRKIKNAMVHQQTMVEHQNIKSFLSDIREPFAAMDMEIWAPAIPGIKGNRPFQQVPFLVCLTAPNSEQNFYTSHLPGDDRENFAQELLKLTQPFQSILVYDKTMEVLAINSLSALFPELKPELDLLVKKLVDLFEPVRDFNYYHPEFGSNFSLKSVSDTLNTGIDYDTIRSGLEAMNYYETARISENFAEKEQMITELVNYCLNDCRATMAFYRHLAELK